MKIPIHGKMPFILRRGLGLQQPRYIDIVAPRYSSHSIRKVWIRFKSDCEGPFVVEIIVSDRNFAMIDLWPATAGTDVNLRKHRVVMIQTLSSLAAPQVVIMINSGVTSDYTKLASRWFLVSSECLPAITQSWHHNDSQFPVNAYCCSQLSVVFEEICVSVLSF